MPYELVRQEGEEKNDKDRAAQDPRTRRDFDAPPWAKVGSEDWHKAWMSEADAGYLDTFNDLYTKMKITRSRYEEQLQSIPFRKRDLKKDRFRAGIMVLVFALIIPVVITVYSDRSFTFITKTPPAPVLIKKALGIDTASGRPNRDKVGQLTQAQVREIATIKMPDLNAASIEAAMSMVKGTARSMGVTVADE